MAFLSRLLGKNRADGLSAERRVEPALHSSDIWSFSPFSMLAIPGFSYVSGRAPAMYANAAGDVAMITVHVLNGTPPPEEAKEIVLNARKHVHGIFSSAAEKYGTSGSDLEIRSLASGDTLLSWAVATAQEEGKGYFLQHAVLSPLGNLTIITVEGRGGAIPATAVLENSIASARFAV